MLLSLKFNFGFLVILLDFHCMGSQFMVSSLIRFLGLFKSLDAFCLAFDFSFSLCNLLVKLTIKSLVADLTLFGFLDG